MLFFKILGFLDFLTVIAMILLSHEMIPWRIGAMFAGYLIIKGVTFKGDAASFLDMIIGFYMLILPIFSPSILTIIFSLYIGQKALISFA